MRPIRNIFILLLIITSFVACQGKEEEGTDQNITVEDNETSKYGGTVRIASVVREGSLFPFAPDAMVGQIFDYAIYNTLVNVNKELKVMPELAEEWDISDDKLDYFLRLRDDVVFHDGTPFTAYDVAKTVGYIMQSENEWFEAKNHLSKVESFRMIGDYEIVFTLSEPDGRFLNNLNYIPILPDEVFTEEGIESFSSHPIGTGPFKFFKLENDTFTLKRNEKYFNGSPYLDSIIEYTIPSQETAWSYLMQGDIDLLQFSDYSNFNVLDADQSYKTERYIPYMYKLLLFNLDKPDFSDVRLRKAISMLIDRDDIIKKVLNNEGVATTGPFPPDSVYYNSDVEEQKKNFTRGRELLEELGWGDSDGNGILDKDGKDIEFTIVTYIEDESNVEIAGRIKWQLYNAGIRINVEAIDVNTLYGERIPAGDYELLLTQYNSGSINPLLYLNLFWNSSNSGKTNSANYKNEVVDGLLEKAGLISDYDKFNDILKEIHKFLAEDYPAVFLVNKNEYFGLNKDLYIYSIGIDMWEHLEEWYFLHE